VDISGAIPIDTVADFDAWLTAHGASEREVVVSIYKKSSGKQTVTLSELQEIALCHGWVDNLGQRVDDERWALRFTPRRPGSNWSALNRDMAKRLLAADRVLPAGRALLPKDLATEDAAE
jgi:uncharacterized protein YdeI (YjbR/CyaY-like superfamily)